MNATGKSADAVRASSHFLAPTAPRAIRFVHTASFSSAHRYFEPALSAQENRDTYGSWYREKGFGHNFRLEAHFEGTVDPLTGMIVNLKHVDRWLKAVTDELDHRHLNELHFFTGVSPTPERIAAHCLQQIAAQMTLNPAASEAATPPARLVKVRLYEGETLWVDAFA